MHVSYLLSLGSIGNKGGILVIATIEHILNFPVLYLMGAHHDPLLIVTTAHPCRLA